MAVGRPRAFDIDQALDSALYVFWEKGYEGASMPELTKAMGINRPSLYAAFGNKEALFRKALDRYSEKATSCMNEALNAPRARDGVAQLLQGLAEASECDETPKGCLFVQAALACGDDAEPIRRELAARRGMTETLVRARLERAKKEGDLPAAIDPVGYAKFIATVVQGMAVQMGSGADRASLLAIADAAMAGWPK